MNLKQSFYSNGKLLLTGEYIVLDGAKALAVPTKYGQSLTIEIIDQPILKWKSIDEKGKPWFENSFLPEHISKAAFNLNSFNKISQRLLQILNAATVFNPNFLASAFTDHKGLLVTTKLDFSKNWGLGSSSTLLNNIAQWANIDAFKLSKATFGGSGYDIACAQHNSPIIYTLNKKDQTINTINFDPVFKSQLFFVHLNKKQDSRVSIKTYYDNKSDINTYVTEINRITNDIMTTATLHDFDNLIYKHELLIGKLTNQIPVKERLFNDYKHAIKSLGGWGGDFILATGNQAYVNSYFKHKGFKTILAYDNMVLS